MSETDRKLNGDLREAILKTIAFFDLFDYPLTAYEIRENLNRSVALVDIWGLLEQGSDLIEEKDGFYFLNGRAEIVMTRQKRYNYSYRKIKIARCFVRLFRLFPFVKVVAVANSLGQYNLRDGSDIDFFVITAPHRLWLSRLYCTGLAKLLNSRPTGQIKKDKICLSFYIATDHLDISDLRLSGDDPYFDYWRHNLILLYNKNRTYENFLLVNGLLADTDQARITAATDAMLPTGFFLNFLENIAKTIQLKIMPAALAAAMNNSDGVVVNDSVLKLYREDRRRFYAEKYGEKINKIFKKDS